MGVLILKSAVYHQFRGSSCRKLLTMSYDYVAVGAGLGKLILCFLIAAGTLSPKPRSREAPCITIFSLRCQLP